MKVVYDHQIFSRAGYGGISKYFVELLRHLEKYDEFSYQLTSKFSNNENLLELCPDGIHTFFKEVNFKGKAKLLSLINDAYSKQQLKRKPFDIFHPTYYSTYFLSHLPKNKPVVVTCYDLIHEKFGDKFPILKKDNAEGKKRIFENSNQIIAISECTKNDIVEYYGINPDKIKVTYLSHDQSGVTQSSTDLSLPKNYLLFVGVRAVYKNFLFFIEAMVTVLKRFPELNIVCAGGGAFSDEELQFFHQKNVADRVVLKKINSKNLPAIYSGALAFFFPSLYEGFGIPVLEAFGNNCPAVLSNQGSLPEVAQDAALYFNPYDKDSLIQAAITIIENTEKRKMLVEKGNQRLKDFSWAKTARQTYEIYQNFS